MKKINATEYYEIIGNEIRVLDGDGVTSRILPATPALVADLAIADLAAQMQAKIDAILGGTI